MTADVSESCRGVRTTRFIEICRRLLLSLPKRWGEGEIVSPQMNLRRWDVKGMWARYLPMNKNSRDLSPLLYYWALEKPSIWGILPLLIAVIVLVEVQLPIIVQYYYPDDWWRMTPSAWPKCSFCFSISWTWLCQYVVSSRPAKGHYRNLVRLVHMCLYYVVTIAKVIKYEARTSARDVPSLGKWACSIRLDKTTSVACVVWPRNGLLTWLGDLAKTAGR